MDERLNLGSKVKELKLGATFNQSGRSTVSFHTLKYDFKPASVDPSKVATLDVNSNNLVTVTVPHLDSSGVPKTVFKGNQRNYAKECVLIIDKKTGEITLEKLNHNIQVKKTRDENTHKAMPAQQPHRLENSTQRTVSKTKVSTGIRKAGLGGIVQRNSPIQGSPSYQHHKSPQQAPAWIANNNQSTLPSIPLIGMDDDVVEPQQHSSYHPSMPSQQQQQQQHHSHHQQQQQQQQQQHYQQQQQQSHHNSMHSQYGHNMNMPMTSGVNSNNHNSAGNNVNTNNHHYHHNNTTNSSNNSIGSGHNGGHHHNSHHHQQQQQQQQHNQLQQHNPNPNHHQQQQQSITNSHHLGNNDVGQLSTSDSSSESESSGSGSDSDDDQQHQLKTTNKQMHQPIVNHHQHQHQHHNNMHSVVPGGSLPALLLDEDLRLSESNSSDSE